MPGKWSNFMFCASSHCFLDIKRSTFLPWKSRSRSLCVIFTMLSFVQIFKSRSMHFFTNSHYFRDNILRFWPSKRLATCVSRPWQQIILYTFLPGTKLLFPFLTPGIKLFVTICFSANRQPYYFTVKKALVPWKSAIYFF